MFWHIVCDVKVLHAAGVPLQVPEVPESLPVHVQPWDWHEVWLLFHVLQA